MSAFTDDEALVRQTLGFKHKQFLHDVSTMVDSSLVNAMQTYKKELLAIASSKGYDNITESVIDDSCEELLERMQSVFKKNMDKFDLYARRNIFSLPMSTDATSAAASKQSLDNVAQELENTRQKYMMALEKKNRLASECDQCDALLKDMRSALFTIKVGSQVLEEYSVAPLDETISAIEQKQVALQAIHTRAMALVNEMEEAHGLADDDTASIAQATGINAAGAFETGKITEAMR